MNGENESTEEVDMDGSESDQEFTGMVNNSINIIKTKDSLSSDGQQFH